MTHLKNDICPICQNKNIEIWCKSKDEEYLTSDREYTYYRCPECNTLFIESFPVSELSEIYPSNYYSFLAQKKNLAVRVKEYLDKRYFKKVLNKYKGKTINVLDVGGGSGWLLDVVRSIHPNIKISQVVDIDENAKKIAEDNGHHFFNGTIEDFKSEHKFDLVLMLNIIEHISNPEATLKQIENLMNQDGIILTKTPNNDSLDARHFQKSYWGGLHCPRHWILFSRKSFMIMLEKTNLHLTSIKYTQGAPFWAWSLLISWKKKGWVKITRERPVVFHPLIPLLHIFFAGFDFIRSTLGAKPSQMVIKLEKKS